jgi:hypothetical protein
MKPNISKLEKILDQLRSTQPQGVTTDDTNLYWSDPSLGKISYRPLKGGPTTDLLTGLKDPQNIVIHNDTIYFEDDNTIKSAPLATGSPLDVIFKVKYEDY